MVAQRGADEVVEAALRNALNKAKPDQVQKAIRTFIEGLQSQNPHILTGEVGLASTVFAFANRQISVDTFYKILDQVSADPGVVRDLTEQFMLFLRDPALHVGGAFTLYGFGMYAASKGLSSIMEGSPEARKALEPHLPVVMAALTGLMLSPYELLNLFVPSTGHAQMGDIAADFVPLLTVVGLAAGRFAIEAIKNGQKPTTEVIKAHIQELGPALHELGTHLTETLRNAPEAVHNSHLYSNIMIEIAAITGSDLSLRTLPGAANFERGTEWL